MYKDEEIIAGTFCYRNSPKGDWKPYTNEALTQKILALQKEIKELKETALFAAKESGISFEQD